MGIWGKRVNVFQSGPGDSADADWIAPCLLVTKSSPPSEGAQRKVCMLEARSPPENTPQSRLKSIKHLI